MPPPSVPVRRRSFPHPHTPRAGLLDVFPGPPPQRREGGGGRSSGRSHPPSPTSEAPPPLPSAAAAPLVVRVSVGSPERVAR